MSRKKNVGVDYLHRHPKMEQSLNIGTGHIIVDRKEWEEVVDYFRQHPEEVEKLGRPQLNTPVISGISRFLYRKIPIVITKWNDGAKGWRCEIADNYENYKPAKYDDINFEDLTFHFRHDIPTHPRDNLVFSTRKDAFKAARFCNDKYLDGKAKIWVIS